MNFFRFFFLGVFLVFGCGQRSEETLVKEGLSFENSAVVSAQPIASKIGAEIIAKGGNAFDAAIATHFALAVCHPVAGNIGGGGFATIYTKEGEAIFLDFREKAPISASRDMYLDGSGNVIPYMSTMGPKSGGVPGSVKGMVELHKRFGSLPWKELVEPAIKLTKGFQLSDRMAGLLNKYRGDIYGQNGENCFLLKGQGNWNYGDILSNPKLKESLELIRDSLDISFYHGKLKSRMLESLGEFGFTHEDFEGYRAEWRLPILFSYRNFEMITAPPPSSGGIALFNLLKMMESQKIQGLKHYSSDFVHLLAEYMRLVYSDRAEYLGDPDFVDIPKALLDSLYVRSRLNLVSMDTVIDNESISKGLETYESEETTHFSIIDNQGNAISVTTTLNGAFGSKWVIPGTGIIWNNEMDDFSIKPGHPNLYDLIGNEANSIMPGKRMLSSMTPTIALEEGKPKLIIGAKGGSRIISSVFLNTVNILDYEIEPNASVQIPRFHHQWKPNRILYEEMFLSANDSSDLVRRGHSFFQKEKYSHVAAILVDDQGIIKCGVDSRGDDAAYGY